jgi:hypothetical protein
VSAAGLARTSFAAGTEFRNYPPITSNPDRRNCSLIAASSRAATSLNSERAVADR